MTSAVSSKTKLNLQNISNESWEDKNLNKCPLWLNVIGWTFIFVPFFFN